MKKSIYVLLVHMILATTLGPMPLPAQQSGPVPQKTAMSPYRELAETAYRSFQKGDNETAAKTARSLEVAWDSNAGFLERKSSAVYHEIDSAMDAFIKPLIGYAKNPPDEMGVKAAYESFVGKLMKADDPWYGAGVDGDIALDESKMPSGLVVLVTKHGSGRQLEPGDIAVVRATGLLPSGTEFRSTKGESEAVFLQTGNKIPGLLEGLGYLHVGDSAILVLPPALGYGATGGQKPPIPPNSALTYFVDVLDVKTKDLAVMTQQTIQSQGVDVAIAQYRDLKKRGFPDIYADELDMNALGYWLLETDRAGAVKIFQLNAEAYPQSANVYDSLGEAYAKNGQKQLARESYQKALAIDPKKESSIEALEKLQSN